MLLMGCSSGALHSMGQYEPTGMALSYVVSGAPATVANLWDVTDRDIDGLTQHVIQVGDEVIAGIPLAIFILDPFASIIPGS